MLSKIDRPDVITANRGGAAVLPSRTLVITLLLSLLLLLSACQLPFTGSDGGDDIEEVQSPSTGGEGAEEGAAEEGEPSVSEVITPATGAAEESAEAGDAAAEGEEPVAAADAGDGVEDTESSAAEEGAEESAADGEGADTDTSAEGEGADAEAAAEDAGADAEAGAEGAGADAEAGAEGAGVDAGAAAEDAGADAEAGAEGAGADAEAGAEGAGVDAGAAAEDAGADAGAAAEDAGADASAQGDSTEAAEGTEESADATTASEGEASATEAGAESSAADEAADGAAGAASSASSTPQVQITADSVEVHDGPGPYNPVIGSLSKDNTVDVMGRNLGAIWYYVKVSDTLDGWIPAESTQGVGAFSANELPVLKAPAIPAPTAMPEPTSTGGGSEGAPAATPTTTESAPAATATPIAQSGAFTYGIQAHLVHIDRRLPFAHTTGLGFGLIKQQIEWKEWEQTEGDINWGEMDAIVQEAQENNLQVLYSVVGAPDWAREAGFDGSVAGPPADPATFASFVSQMATRYCGQNLRAIEVWNEQNLHYEWGNQTLDPAAYMALLKPSYEAIKAACPSMTVVSGALTPAGDIGTLAIDDFTYLQGMFNNGLANVADVVGAHPSGYNVPPSLRYTEACAYLEQKKTPAPTFKGPCDTPHHSWSFLSTLEGYQNIIQQNSSTQKIWATEFGWAAGGSFASGYEYADDNSLDEQAQWSVEAYQYMRDSGYVEAAVLWNLNFRMVANGTEKAQWGIVADNSQPLPAFIALQAMEK